MVASSPGCGNTRATSTAVAFRPPSFARALRPLLFPHRLRSLYTNQKYFFVTSSYQACVLLQFNSSDSLSYNDIEVGTGMNAETLKPILAQFTKQRVIDLKEEMYELNLSALSPPPPPSPPLAGAWSLSDFRRFGRTAFKSKKIRVMLNTPVRSEVKQEAADTLKVRSPPFLSRRAFRG